MAPESDIYFKLYGKTEAEVVRAQLDAVKTVLEVAVKKLYKDAADKKSTVDPTVHDEYGNEFTLLDAEHQPCTTAEDTLAALLDPTTYSAERDCIRAFNQLAEHNGFDLSLKSSGIKSEESLRSKEKRTKNAPIPRDVTRLLVISDDLELRTKFLKDCWAAIDTFNDTVGDPTDQATWRELTNTGVYKDTINKKVKGVPLEIQAVPRCQAAMATRISHRLFRVGQEGDIYLNPQNNFPAENFAELLTAYTTGTKAKPGLAKLINELMDPMKLLSNGTLQLANKVLATDDMSSLTFDKVSEGGAKSENPDQEPKKRDGQPRYSPIFTFAALRDYRNYLLETAPKLPAFKKGGPLLPPLTEESDEKQIGSAVLRLKAYAQLTHICYMREAPQEMRTVFVACALATNAKAHREILPRPLIDDVVKGIKGPEVDMARVDILMRDILQQAKEQQSSQGRHR